MGLRGQQQQTGQGVEEGEAELEEASSCAENSGDHRQRDDVHLIQYK